MASWSFFGFLSPLTSENVFRIHFLWFFPISVSLQTYNFRPQFQSTQFLSTLDSRRSLWASWSIGSDRWIFTWENTCYFIITYFRLKLKTLGRDRYALNGVKFYLSNIRRLIHKFYYLSCVFCCVSGAFEGKREKSYSS